MKKKFLFLLFSLCNFFFVFAQVQKLSSLQPSTPSATMYYLNGTPYTGEVVDFYGDKIDRSKFKFDGHYINGRPMGHIKQWYQNHQLEYDETYGAAGTKEGIQNYYYENGRNKETSFYKNGQLDGKQTKWYSNGKKMSEYTSSSGVANGKWITYDESGQLISEKIFQKGQTTSEVNYNEGKKASEKFYSNGVPVGKWVKYNENEKIESEIEYQSGQVIREALFNKGNVSSEKFYSNGNPSGRWVQYDENNQLTSEIIYDNGKITSQKSYKAKIPEGTWKTTDGNYTKEMVYQNGIIISESNYLYDKLDGKQIEYIDSIKRKETLYKNGEKLSEGVLVHNNQDGKWVYWSGNGQIITVKNYDNGQLTKEEEPKNTANLISNFQPSDNSFLLKIDNYEKPFIRIDLKFGEQTDVYAENVIKIIRYEFSHPSNRLSILLANGQNKDESINYIIEFSGVTVNFDNIVCSSLLNNNKTYGYASTIDLFVTIKSANGKGNDIQTVIKSTTRALLLATCYPSKDEAFKNAVMKDFIKSFINKNFPAKKR